MALKMRIAPLALAAFLFVGCTMRSCSDKRDIPPEDQLHAYVSRAVDVTKLEQRQELIDLTTGPLRSALVNASDESFKRAYIEKRYDFKAFEILERRDVDPGRRVEIDFKLVYRTWNSGEQPDRVPLSETLNRATLEYDYGHWALASVESLKSSMDWDVGLPLDNVSTEGVNPEDPPVEVESSRSLEVQNPEAQ